VNKIIRLFLIGLLVFTLAGLFIIVILFFYLFGGGTTTRFTQDYVRIHSDFLHYSLGDFEVIGEGTDEDRFWNDRAFIKWWTLRFTRQDGNEHTFHFRNSSSFGSSVTRLAGRFGEEELLAITENYFSPNAVTNVSVSMNFQHGKRHNELDFSHVLDPQSGLQLQSVTAKELADWDFTLLITANASDHENYIDTVERFKDMTRALANYSGQERVEVRFRLNTGARIADDHNGWVNFIGHYYSPTDTFTSPQH